jgi:hypothetical protein
MLYGAVGLVEYIDACRQPLDSADVPPLFAPRLSELREEMARDGLVLRLAVAAAMFGLALWELRRPLLPAFFAGVLGLPLSLLVLGDAVPKGWWWTAVGELPVLGTLIAALVWANQSSVPAERRTA